MIRKKLFIRGTKEEDEFELAIKFKDAGDLKSAVRILKTLSKKFPEDKAPWLVLGGIYHYQLKDFKNGEKYFRKGTMIAPDSEMCSIGLFHSLNNQGKTEEAFKEMKRFAKIRPNSRRYAAMLKDMV